MRNPDTTLPSDHNDSADAADKANNRKPRREHRKRVQAFSTAFLDALRVVLCGSLGCEMHEIERLPESPLLDVMDLFS